MPRALSTFGLALLAVLVSGGVFPTSPAHAQATRPPAAKPRVVYNRSASHVPNLLVVARAMSIDVAMRAAGLNRMALDVDQGPKDSGAPGELYTESPLENRTQRTRVDPGAHVVPVLRQIWPEIGELGARTLAAQFALETGSGRHCYNFNLGNHKAGANEPHMYLRGVWEGVPRATFERLRADPTFGELVREETPREIAQKGHLVQPGNIVIAFAPPHPVARFRSHATVEDGVSRFVSLHRRIGNRVPEFLVALRLGDTRGAARILGSSAVRYYTGNVDAYAQGMMNHRDIIDEGLGPPPM